MAREDFPPPVFTINEGQTRVWEARQIEAYERVHPELLDDDMKLRKQRGYRMALNKGPEGLVKKSP